jgi:hypothetical protein
VLGDRDPEHARHGAVVALCELDELLALLGRT